MKKENAERVYDYLKKYPQSTSQEIARDTGIRFTRVRDALVRLERRDRIERSGTHGRYITYRVPIRLRWALMTKPWPLAAEVLA